jgi:cytoskeleton protein RodZ
MTGLELPVDGDEAPDTAARTALGQQLAAARETQGLTVEEIASRLNLRSSFLAAIEEGRGDEHMDWSYERNHIRTIAALLSIDVQPNPQGDAR